MKSEKRILAFFILSFTLISLKAQYEMEPEKGYTAQIGMMADMPEEIKDPITEDLRDLNQIGTDYLFDDHANSIGTMIMHLAATEAYCQEETLEERQWTDEECELYGTNRPGQKAATQVIR